MRHRCHHLGSRAHQSLNGCRQRGGAGSQGFVGVAGFVGLHLRDDGAGFGVFCGQALQVAGQVGFHLALGLDHETQAG